MRNNITYFTNAVSLTMLNDYRTFIQTNRVEITSAVYYKDGVNHYMVVTYYFTV